MTTRVGRNDPCPCGSGLKYKQCCEGKMRVNVRGPHGWILGALAIGVVGLVAWGLVRAQSRPPVPTPSSMPLSSAPATPGPAAGSAPVTSTQAFTVNPAPSTSAPMTMSSPMSATGPAGVAPQAWAYDPKTNKHFDPGHGHWHDGPAPPPEARGTSSISGTAPTGTASMHSDATPAPWTYDAQKNQHWDPGHGHWHQGPPPAGAK